MCKKGDGHIPALCQFWRSLERSLPRFPMSGLHFGLTIVTFVVLTVLRYVTEYTLIYAFGWPMDAMETKLASGSITGAFFHSSNLVPVLYLLFSSPAIQYHPSAKMSDSPVWWQETAHAMLQFCTGYMLYDGLINILLLKSDKGYDADDFMFLGHHIATAVYMTMTRIYNAGHQSAMMCMFLGELTNPLHNVLFVTEFARDLGDCCYGPMMKLVHDVDLVVFSAVYVLVRAILAPTVLGTHMCFDLIFRGRPQLPVVAIILMCLMIWGVILGSIPWIQSCWANLEPFWGPLLGKATAEL